LKTEQKRKKEKSPLRLQPSTLLVCNFLFDLITETWVCDKKEKRKKICSLSLTNCVPFLWLKTLITTNRKGFRNISQNIKEIESLLIFWKNNYNQEEEDQDHDHDEFDWNL
jgi:hypothetical protein